MQRRGEMVKALHLHPQDLRRGKTKTNITIIIFDTQSSCKERSFTVLVIHLYKSKCRQASVAPHTVIRDGQKSLPTCPHTAMLTLALLSVSAYLWSALRGVFGSLDRVLSVLLSSHLVLEARI